MQQTINDLIQSRRATPPRFLAKTGIPRATIEQLLENANWAPNHKKTEPWRFHVYSGAAKQHLAEQIYSLLSEKINTGAEINPQKAEKFKSDLEKVPVAIAIILERDAAERLPEWEEIAAVAMSVQNMWLTATDMGLGAFWASPQFLPMLNEILRLERNQKALGFFYVGQIAMDYPSPGRSDIAAKVKWIE